MVADEHSHQPVLLDEAVDALAPRPDGIYVDGTFGRGGHTRALLARLDPGATVIVLDRDPAAIAAATALAAADDRVRPVRARFSGLAEVVAAQGLVGRVDGVLLDLGVSSPQLDDAARGFGFDSPELDMRMDPEHGESAAAWLARADEADIADVIHHLGEDRFARRIARAIVRRRAERPIESGTDLAEVVAAAVPTRERGKNPATRTFQAVRMHVNAELDELRAGLEAALAVLAPGGRLAVISFHSLEDRIVKQFMAAPPKRTLPRHLPVEETPAVPRIRALGKPRRPAEAEVATNPRARSALLRVAEKPA